MPLPSYAKVTNLENGSSVIVRVNDRGPFHGNRVIDLSRRAAELLDYTNSGTAKVEVSYVGRAPLNGRDDQYLMASYRPGGRAPHPGDNIATGVMIAMNGDTPTSRSPDMPVMLASASPASLPGVASRQPDQIPFGYAETTRTAAVAFPSDPILPDFGPLVPERPPFSYVAQQKGGQLPVMSYADARIEGATAAVNAFAQAGLTPDLIQSSWKRGAAAAAFGEHIAVGTFAEKADAEHAASAIRHLGRAEIAGGDDGYTVDLYPGKPGQNMDRALEEIWALGLNDAMTVRQ
jgi:rare lipoprotein A